MNICHFTFDNSDLSILFEKNRVDILNNCEMGTNEVNVSEEDAMDKLLYIIRDQLPKAAVADLHKFIGKIKSVKSITDMKAYLVIEFYTKVDADAAKAKGFEYELNGQHEKLDFATTGVVQVYMAEACKTFGTGF